jgi:hypothetical protein
MTVGSAMAAAVAHRMINLTRARTTRRSTIVAVRHGECG